MSDHNRSGVVVVGHDNLPAFLFLGVGVLMGWLIGSSRREAPADGPQTDKARSGSRVLDRSLFGATVSNVGPILDLGELADFYKEAAAAIDMAIEKIAAAGGGNPASSLYPVYTYLVNLRLALDKYAEGQANDRLKPFLAQLTQLGKTLKTEAQAIPDATTGLNDLNSFLGTVTAIVNVLKK